jgi:hypothetical protein
MFQWITVVIFGERENYEVPHDAAFFIVVSIS